LFSMTGFGEARHQDDRWAVSVEIRTVNNRHLKLSVKATDPYSALEPEIDRSGRWIYFLRRSETSGPRLYRMPVDGSAEPSVVSGDIREHRSVDFR